MTQTGASRSITFLTTESLTESSSIGRYHPLGKELVRRGWSVRFLMLHNDFGAVRPRREQVDGIDVHYVGQRHVRYEGTRKIRLGGWRLVSACAAAIARMVWIAVREQPDRRMILYVCKPLPQTAVAGVIAAALGRCRLVFDIDDYEAESTWFGRRWQYAVVRWIEDVVPRSGEQLTLNTRFSVARYVALGYPEDDLFYLPNGFDPERFRRVDPAVVANLRKRFCASDDTRLILYFGALDIRSGHALEELIEAFALVWQALPHARLLLLGRGNDRAPLQGLAERLGVGAHVLFQEKVPASEVPAYVAMADVSVDPVVDSPASCGRSPLKILESMAAGTPVVTGRLAERIEMLDDGRAGVLVKPGDPAALAEGILEVLRDPERAQTLRTRARERAARYDWSALAAAFERRMRRSEASTSVQQERST